MLSHSERLAPELRLQEQNGGEFSELFLPEVSPSEVENAFPLLVSVPSGEQGAALASPGSDTVELENRELRADQSAHVGLATERDGILAELSIARRELALLGDKLQERAVDVELARTVHTRLKHEHDSVIDEIKSLQTTLADRDQVLLCTDGLTEMVDDAAIAEVLRDAPGAAEACQRLVARALQNGGRDNVTVALARYRITPGN